MKRIVPLTMALLLALARPPAAQPQDLGPAPLTFTHEDSGSADPRQQVFNLRLLNPQDPTQQATLTHFTTPATILGAPAWSKDHRELAFSGNFNAAVSSEADSIFGINPDGSGLQQITGFGVLGTLPGPTGTVVGRVVAPDLGNAQSSLPGSVRACFISAQGTAGSAGCDTEGRFTLNNVPVGAHWVRAQAYVTYDDPSGAIPTGGPGLSLGFTNISVRAGQVTDAGTILIRPQFSLAGAAWSPVEDRIVCAAGGAAAGESYVILINPDGSGVQALYQTPLDVASGVLPLITECRWSPNGGRVAFVQASLPADSSPGWSDLFVINSDGSGLRRLTAAAPTQFVRVPTWSPNGQYLAFDVAVSTDNTITIQRSDLFAIGADGTGLTRLTNDGRSCEPGW